MYATNQEQLQEIEVNISGCYQFKYFCQMQIKRIWMPGNCGIEIFKTLSQEDILLLLAANLGYFQILKIWDLI